MQDDDLRIDDDVARAHTLPARFYRDPALFERLRERVFARAWHLLPDPPEREHVQPFELLPGFLGEPLVLCRDGAGALRCLSNVCTHRGNLIALEAGPARTLRCGYHGRRFGLDGRCQHMPEFEGVVGFPSARDDLPSLPLDRLGPLWFGSLEPHAPFEALVGPLARRLAHLPLDRLVPDPASAKSYHVDAHFALYLDNFLEGFHVPFVHPGLSRVVVWDDYPIELFPHASLQIGIARDGEEAFAFADASLPEKRVAAYWAWLWPGTMLNFYPWGLSANVVVPEGLSRTRIEYRTWLWDPARRGAGAGADLETVEQEDEAIVEKVQRGVRARLYRRGRFSPSREPAVHHFHRMLSLALGA